MSKYVSLDKRSKKQQKEYHSKQRRTWGELNPVTRSVPNGKAYNRKKEKERVSKEFRDGFGADSFFIMLWVYNECIGFEGVVQKLGHEWRAKW